MAVLFLILFCLAVLLPIFKISRSFTKRSYEIKEVTDRTSDALNYILPYILAFVDIDLKKWQDVIFLIIVLTLVYIVYSNSNLIYINPIFILLGIKIYDAKLSTNERIIILSKKTLKINTRAYLKSIHDTIYICACDEVDVGTTRKT